MHIASIHVQTRKLFSGFPTAFLPLVLSSVFPIHELWALFTRVLILSLVVLFARKQLSRPTFILIVSWLFLSTLWSVNPPQSFAATFQLCAYILLYSLFRYRLFHEAALRWGIRLLVSSAIVLSAYGLYQLLYGYEEYFSMLETTTESLLPVSREIVREWLTALSGRVFSRFALPSQFSAYLLMLFPLHGVLLARERRIGLKFLWGGGLLLNGIMFIYTKSFGAWFTLLCLIAFGTLLFLVQRQAITWRRMLAGGLIMILLCLGMTYIIGILRGQHLWNFQGNNPLWFRLLNWKAAAGMWRDHLFLGTGLSTFGILYPHYMPPGANESNYAHNSYLQIGVEHGIVGLLLALWLILAWGYTAFSMLKKQSAQYSESSPSPSPSRTFFVDIRYASAFGGLAFLLHNIIDFDLYVFPLGAIGIALLALTINCGEQKPRSQQQSLRVDWGAICVGCGLFVAGVLDWQQTEANRQYTAARIHVQAQRYDEAEEASRKALQTWPIQPTYHALAGSVVLFQQSPDTARQHFQTAVQADPNTPWFHAGLAEAYLADYNLGLAYAESRRAAELFPQKPEYGQRTQEIQNAFPAF